MITILTIALINTVIAITVIVAIDNRKNTVKKDDLTSEIGVLITEKRI